MFYLVFGTSLVLDTRSHRRRNGSVKCHKSEFEMQNSSAPRTIHWLIRDTTRTNEFLDNRLLCTTLLSRVFMRRSSRRATAEDGRALATLFKPPLMRPSDWSAVDVTSRLLVRLNRRALLTSDRRVASNYFATVSYTCINMSFF